MSDGPTDDPRPHGVPVREGPGRPTKYRPEYVKQAEKLFSLGFTDVEMADFFEVSVATLFNWRKEHPEFLEAGRTWKVAADDRVERSLYSKAMGYSYDSVKILQYEGSPVVVPYREHVPPSDTAAIFWLKNRRPQEWRDRSQLEHSGPEGAPIPVQFYIPSNGRDVAPAVPALDDETEE